MRRVTGDREFPGQEDCGGVRRVDAEGVSLRPRGSSAAEAADAGCGGSAGRPAGATRKPAGSVVGRPARTAQRAHQRPVAAVLRLVRGRSAGGGDCRLSLSLRAIGGVGWSE